MENGNKKKKGGGTMSDKRQNAGIFAKLEIQKIDDG